MCAKTAAAHHRQTVQDVGAYAWCAYCSYRLGLLILTIYH